MSEEGTTPVIQPILLPMICKPVGEEDGVESTPHHAAAPDNTVESNTFQQTGGLTVALARRITLADTTSPDRQACLAEIESGRDSTQAHPAIPGILVADDEEETTVPTCPSPPTRPKRPINWGDTYIDIQSMQRSQAVAAMEDAAQAHSLAVTIADKSKEEEKNDLFVNISLNLDEMKNEGDLDEMKNEGGQETMVEGHEVEEEERWEFACGFGWLERWWKRCTGVNSRS